MAMYQDRGGTPHFDGKNYPMWVARMSAFLCGKGQKVGLGCDHKYHVCHTANLEAEGASTKFEANAKVMDYLFRLLCADGFERVLGEDLVCKILKKYRVAHGGDNHVKARFFLVYHKKYENFAHFPGDSIDTMLRRFTSIATNMKANITILRYDDHDRALKLFHSLDRTV
jgi:hypothetical protein